MVSPNGLLIVDGFDESKGTCDPMNDPMYQDTTHGRNFKMIGLKDAYAFIKASGLKLNPVKIGVLDTRLYKPCDELGGGINVSTTEAEDYNDNPQKNDKGAIINGGLTHGTMVNEVLGANAENGGVTGVASPVGDKLTIVTTNIYKKDDYEVSTPDPEDPSKVVSQGVTYVHTTLKAMLDQIKNGATIINCSYGPKNYDDDHSFETALYEKFYKKIQEKYPKVVIVGSAGNSNKPLTGTNGANKGQKVGNLLTVGAIDKDGKKSSYSNYATPNAEVSISAPADDMILGMDKNGKPITASGTSLAAPQVAGTVALIQSLNPDLTAQEIKNILQSTADKVIDGRNMSTPIPNGMGTGMLRVDNAILKVINDLRIKQGLPILTKENMLAMTSINLTYNGGPEEYKIKASISAISGSSTTLTLDIVGNNYSLSGKPTQTLASPGEATWSLTMKPDTKVTAKVSRSDTKSCAWVVIESVEFTGKWKIMGTITSAKLDASLGTFKDMGEKIYGADRGELDAGQKEAEQSMIGKEVPLSEIDVESWKYMGCKITKEGSTIVITPPGADNPKALGSMIYYIENITGNTFTGRAIAKNHFGGKDNEIHYTITGTRIE
ncbi:MAG: S8/S53 family peptidase [Chitinophagaceae bacterium]|nr:S8/S53 family peptidase [Chitinophagaceae bacterium]